MKPLATQCTRGLRRALAPARAVARGRRLRPCATLLRRRPAQPPAASRAAAPPAALAIAVSAAWHAHLHLHAAAPMLAMTRRDVPRESTGAWSSAARDARHARPDAPLEPARRAALAGAASGRIDAAARTREAATPPMPGLVAAPRLALVARRAAAAGAEAALAVRASVMRTRPVPHAVAASDSDRATAQRAPSSAAVAPPPSAPLVLMARRGGVPGTAGTAPDPRFAAPARRADLVWRKTNPATATGDALDAPAPAPAARAAPFAAALSAAAPPALTRLDPALADRLADEVLKRVERQARIARERRGL